VRGERWESRHSSNAVVTGMLTGVAMGEMAKRRGKRVLEGSGLVDLPDEEQVEKGVAASKA